MLLRFLDVDRYTSTNIDGAQSTIRDYWNLNGAHDLSDEWVGFTRFTLRRPNPASGYM